MNKFLNDLCIQRTKLKGQVKEEGNKICHTTEEFFSYRRVKAQYEALDSLIKAYIVVKDFAEREVI